MSDSFDNPEEWLLMWSQPPESREDLPVVVRRSDFTLMLIESVDEWRYIVTRLRKLGAQELQPAEAHAMRAEREQMRQQARAHSLAEKAKPRP
jgi:hypothetical protein